MNDLLRDRINRKLDALSDERLYQVLDYVEFLESRYAERQAPPPSVFSRFAEGIEDTLRAGRVSTNTITETMGFLNKAVGVLNGVAAAGKSVASDVVGAAQRAADTVASATTPSGPAGAAGGSTGGPTAPGPTPPPSTPPNTTGDSTQ